MKRTETRATEGSEAPAHADGGQSEASDGWASRIAKLIPAEAMGLYGASVNLVGDQLTDRERTWVLLALAGIALAFAAAIRIRSTAAGGARPQWTAVAIALISFVLWLLALGAPTSPLALPERFEFAGPLAAFLWATVITYFYKGDASPAASRGAP